MNHSRNTLRRLGALQGSATPPHGGDCQSRRPSDGAAWLNARRLRSKSPVALDSKITSCPATAARESVRRLWFHMKQARLGRRDHPSCDILNMNIDRLPGQQRCRPEGGSPASLHQQTDAGALKVADRTLAVGVACGWVLILHREDAPFMLRGQPESTTRWVRTG